MQITKPLKNRKMSVFVVGVEKEGNIGPMKPSPGPSKILQSINLSISRKPDNGGFRLIVDQDYVSQSNL